MYIQYKYEFSGFNGWSLRDVPLGVRRWRRIVCAQPVRIFRVNVPSLPVPGKTLERKKRGLSHATMRCFELGFNISSNVCRSRFLTLSLFFESFARKIRNGFRDKTARDRKIPNHNAIFSSKMQRAGFENVVWVNRVWIFNISRTSASNGSS